MGGECFKILQFRHGLTGSRPQVDPDENAVKQYTELFPSLVSIAQSWWTTLKQSKEGWTFRASLEDGIYIDDPNELFWAIVIPAHKPTNELRVGWQHRRYATEIDPKKEVGELLINAFLTKASLMAYIMLEEMDCVLEDLGCYDRDEREEFTPSSGYYWTGLGERVYCFVGEGQDLTACDKECGYCGRCPY